MKFQSLCTKGLAFSFGSPSAFRSSSCSFTSSSASLDYLFIYFQSEIFAMAPDHTGGSFMASLWLYIILSIWKVFAVFPVGS